jgi:drug/metabolite transporter (DMT)-like permease
MGVPPRPASLPAVATALAIVYLVWGSTYLGIRFALEGGYPLLVYLTVFGSIVAFSAYIWLLHNVRTTLAGSYAYVNSVIAVVLGAWLASERFTAHDLGAMAVILGGVVAITLARARPLAAPTAKALP